MVEPPGSTDLGPFTLLMLCTVSKLALISLGVVIGEQGDSRRSGHDIESKIGRKQGRIIIGAGLLVRGLLGELAKCGRKQK